MSSPIALRSSLEPVRAVEPRSDSYDHEDPISAGDAVVQTRTSVFDVAVDGEGLAVSLSAAASANVSARGFAGRVRGAALARLEDNRQRLLAAEASMDGYTGEDWAQVVARARLDRDLGARHEALALEASRARTAAAQLGSVRVGGFGPQSRARAAALVREAEVLEASAAEVRAVRAELHQADPVAAVLARHPEVDDASPATRAQVARRELGQIRAQIQTVALEVEAGPLDPLDLEVVVQEQAAREQLSARAGAGDEDAQAILSSLRYHARSDAVMQGGAALAVGGLSLAGMMLGGGVALVGGLAGAADSVRGFSQAARLERAAQASGAGGAALVHGAEVRQAYVLAKASLLLTALDVVQVAGAAHKMISARRLRKLYDAAEALEGLSSDQVRRLDAWVQQRATGQTEVAARTRAALEAELGSERWAKVSPAFERVISDLSSARVTALREALGEQTFTRLGARFGGDTVSGWVASHGAARVRDYAQALSPEATKALLEGLDPVALARLDPLSPTEVEALAGRIGLEGLRKAASTLDGAGLKALDEAFGPDLGQILKVASPEDWAAPEVVAALAGRDRAAVLEVLGRGTRPKTLATVVRRADQHLEAARAHANPNNPISPDLDLADDLLDYLRTQPPEEAEAAARMLEAELLDDGHAILRHGPQITDAAIVRRLRTGIAADGTQGRGHWASTRFRSFRVMARSREAAWKALREVENVDPRYGPNEGPNPDDTSFLVTIEHGRAVSRGVYSAAPPTVIPNPRNAGQTVRVYCEHVDSAPALTRSQARIVWEDGRWQVKQHFPGVKDLDRNTGAYVPDADATTTLRRPK